MKKNLFFVLAACVFAACEQAPIKEQSAIRDCAPETLTVGFEGDDTRIHLNEAQKTVWTKGDLLSVFYCSTINEQWKFMGETGDRIGQIAPVDNSVNPPATHDRVVVVYPYSGGYNFNTETYNVKATLPATQHYLKNSYGLDGNILISLGESNDIALKSVCGWLKLQLTGDGKVVKSIKFRGNNGEQVAGELYINSADATVVLASKMGDAADNNAGGSLVFDDTILTEVVLDCGEGVTLGAEATAFYIALPPQTFEKGFTVDVMCDGYTPMTISTGNTLTIERNHIQPMAAKEVSLPSMYYGHTPADMISKYNLTAINPNGYFSNITEECIKECVEKGYMIETDAKAMGRTSIGIVPKGSLMVIAVPSSSNLEVKQDNGFGAQIEFTVTPVTNGEQKTTVNGISYDLYGQYVSITYYNDKYFYVNNK